MLQQTRTTKITTEKQIERIWHEVNADNQIVGRIATQIATKLMGKSKLYFVKNLDCGDYVVVTNAKDVQVTGKKASQKIYTQYSGYPGGLQSETFASLKSRKPEEIIRRAVLGMLPKNKLRDSMMKRLYIYKDNEHPYKDKIRKA